MIDTNSLRYKVLKLAMRGELSTRMTEDGNLVDKYKNIAIENENEMPYAIPATWIWVMVKDVIKKDVGGGTPSKSIDEYWKNGDIPWASVKDFSSAEGGYLKDTIDHITQKGLDNSSANMVDENAIVICMRMALGKIIRVARPMAINQDLRAVWLNELADEDYFVYFYSTLKVEGRGMTVSGIRKDELMNYQFPLPPIEEQKRIVQRLNEIFETLDTIDELQKAYCLDVEVLKNKLIDAGIQGKLTKQLPEDGTAEELYADIQNEKARLIKEKKIKKEKTLAEVSEEEIPFEIPANWKWVRLEEISNRIWAGGDKPDDFSKEATDDLCIPVVANGVTDDGILGYTRTAKAPAETITVAGRGTIGFCVYRDYEYCPIVRLIVVEPANGIDPRYLKIVMQAMQESSVGSSIPQLTVPMIKPKLIPLPPYEEQKRIVNRLEVLLESM